MLSSAVAELQDGGGAEPGLRPRAEAAELPVGLAARTFWNVRRWRRCGRASVGRKREPRQESVTFREIKTFVSPSPRVGVTKAGLRGAGDCGAFQGALGGRRAGPA